MQGGSVTDLGPNLIPVTISNDGQILANRIEPSGNEQAVIRRQHT